MTEKELRILCDHLFKYRRIFFEQNINIKVLLNNTTILDEEKVIKINEVLTDTTSKLNAQYKSYKCDLNGYTTNQNGCIKYVDELNSNTNRGTGGFGSTEL